MRRHRTKLSHIVVSVRGIRSWNKLAADIKNSDDYLTYLCLLMPAPGGFWLFLHFNQLISVICDVIHMPMLYVTVCFSVCCLVVRSREVSCNCKNCLYVLHYFILFFYCVPALGPQIKFSTCANSSIFTLKHTADMLINVHCSN